MSLLRSPERRVSILKYEQLSTFGHSNWPELRKAGLTHQQIDDPCARLAVQKKSLKDCLVGKDPLYPKCISPDLPSHSHPKG